MNAKEFFTKALNDADRAQLEKIRSATNADELCALARENGVEGDNDEIIAAGEAAVNAFKDEKGVTIDNLEDIELSDEALDGASGGVEDDECALMAIDGT